MDVIAAQPWHFWFAPFMILGAIVVVVTTIVGYFRKVVRPRYPRD